MMRMVLALASAIALVSLGCGPVVLADDATGEPPAAPCAMDDVPFDPHDGLVLQGVAAEGDDTCVRLERAPLADVRRGNEWRAVSLFVVAAGRAFAFDAPALAYENSHHNCQDVVTAVADDVTLTLTIDGVTDDANVCFDGDTVDAWRLLLSVNGQETTALAPYVADVPR